MYSNLYELLQTHIYGVMELTPDMELTLTMLATIGCVFMVSIPFLLIYKVLRML